MNVYLDCFPCFMRQALEAARMATSDVRVQRRLLDRVAESLPSLPLAATPVDMGQRIHRLVREITGVSDPYQAVKKRSNDLGLALYPQLKSWVERSSDRLSTALKIAGAGNIIDFAPKLVTAGERSLDRVVQESFDRALRDSLAEPAYQEFKQKLKKANQVLYLGDNTGEIVCDKILIEELVRKGKRVTFVVRGKPVINDATLDDASYIGLDEIAEVMANGSDAPGTILSDCSPEFRAAFAQAKLIIAKGQGNFESLSEVAGPIFFLFKVKCPVIAGIIGSKIGAIVLNAPKKEGD